MKLTWTFYPRHQDSVTLTVVYVPELDNHHLPKGGFLYEPTNTAYVNYDSYRCFDKGDTKMKQDAFGQLIRIPEPKAVLPNALLIEFKTPVTQK
ncbi:hypothetical protein [Runella slithyformis]|uniref:Uncharacterized protein n=1 Tax=Runella slithyformis (strain ATCC 29530 / DSM 19594 / LMG 11500 / NCIMB 11436 / LSU 4) TaxID=761193 RepID=A0A7U3ZI77_RUNSL|nr:hypothetical protein [Runella slithyformis]AEI47632.1 hypothetical protein Runsl_1203 [Runella slithyformis DSM 19594]